MGAGLSARRRAVRFEESRRADLLQRLTAAAADTANAVNLLWNTSSVRARFENTGWLSRDHALALGLVGVAARASGVERDVRAQFPSGHYRFAQIHVSGDAAGNVFARAYVRWQEIQRSLAFLQNNAHLPSRLCSDAMHWRRNRWVTLSEAGREIATSS